jgi:hypothetical protein
MTRMCVTCRTTPAHIFCRECGPAFKSYPSRTSSWGYFRAPDTFTNVCGEEVGTIPRYERDAYGSFERNPGGWRPGDLLEPAAQWLSPAPSWPVRHELELTGSFHDPYARRT